MIKVNALVTGAGSLLGQGILRTLRQITGYQLNIIACDPDHRSSGLFLSDKFVKIPFVKDAEYMEAIERIIEINDIDILFIGTDVELEIFSLNKNRLEEKYSVKIIVGDEKAIKIGDDKWETYRFLVENGFHYPKTALGSNIDSVNELVGETGFPVIVKPRKGARSIGLYKVEDKQSLNQILEEFENLVIQEYLGSDREEYTAGTITLEGRIVSCIVLRRDLRDGNTYRAYHENNHDFNKEITDIAGTLEIEGPCNFQFRIKNGRPVVFEINSRFSGTTPIRFMFGLNEIQIVMDFYFKNEVKVPKELKYGAVLRTISDIFIEHNEWNRISQVDPILSPKAEFVNFFDK